MHAIRNATSRLACRPPFFVLFLPECFRCCRVVLIRGRRLSGCVLGHRGGGRGGGARPTDTPLGPRAAHTVEHRPAKRRRSTYVAHRLARTQSQLRNSELNRPSILHSVQFNSSLIGWPRATRNARRRVALPRCAWHRRSLTRWAAGIGRAGQCRASRCRGRGRTATTYASAGRSTSHC